MENRLNWGTPGFFRARRSQSRSLPGPPHSLGKSRMTNTASTEAAGCIINGAQDEKKEILANWHSGAKTEIPDGFPGSPTFNGIPGNVRFRGARKPERGLVLVGLRPVLSTPRRLWSSKESRRQSGMENCKQVAVTSCLYGTSAPRDHL